MRQPIQRQLSFSFSFPLPSFSLSYLSTSFSLTYWHTWSQYHVSWQPFHVALFLFPSSLFLTVLFTVSSFFSLTYWHTCSQDHVSWQPIQVAIFLFFFPTFYVPSFLFLIVIPGVSTRIWATKVALSLFPFFSLSHSSFYYFLQKASTIITVYISLYLCPVSLLPILEGLGWANPSLTHQFVHHWSQLHNVPKSLFPFLSIYPLSILWLPAG